VPVAKTWRGLVADFNMSPTAVQKYFGHLPKLVEDFPLDVTLSYVFSQIELAHNLTLYCGVVKLHRANAVLARNAIDNQHLTRDGFRERFVVVFGKAVPDSTVKKLTRAESIRDRVMHGKSTTSEQKREAIALVVEYAHEFNEFVHSIAKWRPIGELRGFKGRAKPVDVSTTRWMLKGMGFSLS
jgi:hypothetical protein